MDVNQCIYCVYTQVLVDSHGGKDDGVMVDFRGNPVDKSRTGGWLAAGLILGNRYIMHLH